MVKPSKANKYLTLFQDFVADIRIVSKEVVSDDPRGVPLVLWESQRRLIKEVGGGLDDGIHQFFALKSRQLGVTTVSLAIDVFWLAMHNNIIGAMVTDNEANREANRALITKYVNSFEDGYFGDSFKIVASNREMMQFSNGAIFRFLVAGTKKKSISWAEGTGYSLLHCTETSKYANPEGLRSLIEGFAQTNPNRLLIMESTANGFNHWKNRWEAAAADPYTQRAFFIGWWSGDTNRIERRDPRFTVYGKFGPNKEERTKIAAVKQLYNWEITPEQLAWIRWKETDAGRDQDLLQQNQPWTAAEAFVESGYSFFTVRDINKDMNRIMDANKSLGKESPYVYQGYRYNNGDDFFTFTLEKLDPGEAGTQELVELKVWEEPKQNGKYVIGYDVAYGRNDHKDGNVITVWRCYADKIIQVAEYATYGVDVRHAAWAFFHICAAYGDVMGNLEIGGPGRLVMSEFQHLRELLGAEHNQARVKERNWEDAASQARWYLYHKPDSMGAGYIYNFETNWSTKPRLMHNLRSCYATHEIEIKSRKLLEEMLLVMVDEDGAIGAPDSSDIDSKDDRVFSMAFATLAWTDWIRKDMLAQGKTFEQVGKEESGEITPLTKTVGSIVYRFLATQEELANLEPPRGTAYEIANGFK